MRLKVSSTSPEWELSRRLFGKLANLVSEKDRGYLSYFLFLASGGKSQLDRKASFGGVVSSLDPSSSSTNVVWETPEGSQVLSRKSLRAIADEMVLRERGRATESSAKPPLTVPEVLSYAKTSKKVDYPKDFKEALTFIEKELKKLQKEYGTAASYEQLFFQAYENLMDVTPDFCAVWDRFALAKGLKNRGWSIRADSIPMVPDNREARSPHQDLALDLQRMLGPKIGGFDFSEMAEKSRGCVSLYYGKQAEQEAPQGIEYHLLYAPTGSALDVVVLANGEEVARFSEDNENLVKDLLHRVVSDAQQRWLSTRTAAQFPMQDEVDLSLPKSSLPDRRGWHQMLHQVYLATRDYLRHEVPFFPEKMFLMGERWNGDTIEYTMRGDRANTAVYVTGSLDLSGSPILSLESTYEKDGTGWTTVTPFMLGQYDKASDLVRDIQAHLSSDLDRGLKRLSECPSTTDQILQRVLTSSLLG